MDYLAIANKAKTEFRKAQADKAPDQPTADITEGRIIAVEICSNILGAHIWFAFDDDFVPSDGQMVFYASELPHLVKMSPEDLRRRYEEKRALDGGWIRTRKTPDE